MRYEEYSKLEGVNWSTLKEMRKSPLDYKLAVEYPQETTGPMMLGSAVDCGLLTPEEFDSTYIKAPVVMWTNKGDKQATVGRYQKLLGFNDEKASFLVTLTKSKFSEAVGSLVPEGKVLIPEESTNKADPFTWDRVKSIIDTNKDKPIVKDLLSRAVAIQQGLVGECEETGLSLKGLLDIETAEGIHDLKTISQLGKMFANIRAYDYLGQVAFYTYLAKLNGLEKTDASLLFIETVYPYKAKQIVIDPAVIRNEHSKNLELLKQLKHCIDTDSFTDGSEIPLIYEHREDGQEPAGEKLWLMEEASGGQDEL